MAEDKRYNKDATKIFYKFNCTREYLHMIHVPNELWKIWNVDICEYMCLIKLYISKVIHVNTLVKLYMCLMFSVSGIQLKLSKLIIICIIIYIDNIKMQYLNNSWPIILVLVAIIIRLGYVVNVGYDKKKYT